MIYFILAVILALFVAGAAHKFSRYGKDMTWSYAFFWAICKACTPLLYKMRIVGVEKIPEKGGALLFANHTAYADVILMGLMCPRPVRFLSWAGFEKKPLSRAFMRLMGTIPIAPDKAREGLRLAKEALHRGEIVCIFPEGAMTRNGSIQLFLGGFQLLASKTNIPVIPVYIDGLWASIFSYRYKKFFWKRPQISRLQTTFLVGDPFKMGKEPGEKNISQARQILLNLGSQAFAMRPSLQKKHVAEMLVEACAKHPFKIGVIDHSRERKVYSRGVLVAVSHCLSKRVRKHTSDHRIGIVLPAGTPGMLANYAVSFAGKIPVNINFTLGKSQVEHCLAKAGIKTMISVKPVKEQLMERVPEFPWTGEQIDLLDWLKDIKKYEIIIALAQLVLLPGFIVKRLWKIPRHGGEREAALLFTSGSSGMPKAAVISHRNIIANVMQIEDYDILPPNTRLLCNLPIFHCFGFTTLLWYASTQNVVAITTPSPLDFARNIKAIEEDKATVMISTPTFLRTFLKKASPQQMESIYLVIAGAEKSPDGFAQAWEEKFPDSYYLDGYGMTEAAPVVSVNKPDVVVDADLGEIHPGTRAGSVGILFPGMSAKVTDLDSGEICDFGKPGMLYLKGPNIFPGYLDENGVPVTATDKDGWYKTGDVVTLDEYGFITIKGRLSRFSKIGGEMVPHGTIEEVITEILKLDSDQLQIAITSRPDPTKGEQIVLLTTITDLNLQNLCKKLSDAGLANLWLPRYIKIVDKIPVLGTGKLDIQKCAEIAAQQ